MLNLRCKLKRCSGYFDWYMARLMAYYNKTKPLTLHIGNKNKTRLAINSFLDTPAGSIMFASNSLMINTKYTLDDIDLISYIIMHEQTHKELINICSYSTLRLDNKDNLLYQILSPDGGIWNNV